MAGQYSVDVDSPDTGQARVRSGVNRDFLVHPAGCTLRYGTIADTYWSLVTLADQPGKNDLSKKSTHAASSQISAEPLPRNLIRRVRRRDPR